MRKHDSFDSNGKYRLEFLLMFKFCIILLKYLQNSFSTSRLCDILFPNNIYGLVKNIVKVAVFIVESQKVKFLTY